jgi:hypothetical protein
LDEIEWLLAHHGFQLVIGARGVMRDTQVADAAVLLPAAQRRDMRFPVDEIVHLHEVDVLDLEQRKGALHLSDAGLMSARPNLRGDEGAFGIRRARQQLAQHGLSATIHGRTVERFAASVAERTDNISERFELVAIVG